MTTRVRVLFLALSMGLAACTSVAPGAPSPAAPTPTGPAPATPSETPPTTSGPASPAPGSGPLFPPRTVDPAALDSRTFISQSIGDEGVTHGLVQGTAVRLTFQGASLSANAGCNTMSGTYAIDDGKLVAAGDWATTEIGCQPALQAQDQWLSAFLSSQPRITLNGDSLVLISGGTAMDLLDKEVAEPDQPLIGTAWTLSSIISGDAVSSVPQGVTASIKFNQDGSVEFQTGCNSGRGTYTVGENSIDFADMAMTAIGCVGSPHDVEDAFVAATSGDSITYSIDSGTLTIMAGANGLQFLAS